MATAPRLARWMGLHVEDSAFQQHQVKLSLHADWIITAHAACKDVCVVVDATSATLHVIWKTQRHFAACR